MRVNRMSQVRIAKKDEIIIFKNAACIVTLDFDATAVFDSTSPLILGLRHNEDLIVRDGVIAAIGPGTAKEFESENNVTVIDAHAFTLMPGLVDCHAHPIFGGSRAQETVLKSQGLDYEEIAKRGGGILASVRATREASNENLTSTFVRNAQTALSRGVVLMESKTGYGLSPRDELRLLECMYAAYRAQHTLPFIAPTLLGPHAASPDYHGLDEYIQALIDFLPQFASMNVAADRAIGLPLSVDAFVERNYFTVEQAERWFSAALQYGLDVHIHADEFSRSGGSALAAMLAKKREQSAFNRNMKGRVLSVDHCQYATESDLSKLHTLGVAAVTLPMTSFFSNIPYVEAPRLRASGIRVAIASDFNPGSAPINNLWFAAFLGLTRCGFSLPEVFLAVTKNAAYALGAEENFGTLAVNRPGHVVAYQGTSPEDFFSSPLGDHIEHVILAI